MTNCSSDELYRLLRALKLESIRGRLNYPMRIIRPSPTIRSNASWILMRSWILIALFYSVKSGMLPHGSVIPQKSSAKLSYVTCSFALNGDMSIDVHTSNFKPNECLMQQCCEAGCHFATVIVNPNRRSGYNCSGL